MRGSTWEARLEIALTVGLIAFLFMLDCWATLKVARDQYAERRQRIAQLLLVWLVPLIGALCIIGVHRRGDKPSGQYQRGDDTYGVFEGTGVGRSISTVADVVDDD